MSEYWVSKKKYFCKYCDIYIADDAPSRTQHENGLRHQGNKERYVRNLYKTAERSKKDADEEKREMKRIEAAAAAAYSADVGAGHGPSTSSSGPSAAPSYQPKPKPAKMGISMSNYTTAADLGIVDEEAMKAAAEAAVRQSEGRIGAWEVVTPSHAPVAANASTTKLTPHMEAERKRAAEALEDEDAAHSFQVKKRKLAPGLLGDIYDPIIVKVKRKDGDAPPKSEDASTPEMNDTHARSPAPSVPDAPRPGWAPLSFNNSNKTPSSTPSTGAPASKPDNRHADARGESPNADPPTDALAHEAPSTAQEEHPDPVQQDDRPPKVEEDAEPTPTPAPSMFRKRKVPATGTASRGRRHI
ncbi:hypothetical protein EXIGLDRAFT_722285 [Exidia glandulosa HHB12029]|uniref:Matrin-type domain-containing protein n=1 Tax=Exidia glandulosa HHB12029 TaxID=1314781 RepID=A0A165N535_EXIGL|nr:hypothetical protein EXIGLDRAFT_722285 [Exidia glandulosa HHB12029]